MTDYCLLPKKQRSIIKLFRVTNNEVPRNFQQQKAQRARFEREI
jgi:hypothetical protein